MQSSRREFLDDFLAFVGESNDSDARDVGERLLNRAIERIYLKHPFRQFRAPSAYEITTVAGTRSYSLPDWFGRVLPRAKAFNLTQQSYLEPIDEQVLKAEDPTIGTSGEVQGIPEVFWIGGMSALETEVATGGSALEVVSDNASDIEIVVTIEGCDSTGRQKRTKVTLTGTTPVALGTWKAPVIFIGKAYPATSTPATELTSSRGVVTVQIASGGAALLKLQPDESSAQHQLVSFARLPNAVYTIAIPYLIAPRPLIYDSDPLPKNWTPAVWEEMVLQWRVNTGELATDAGVARPHFIDLVAFDNAQGPPPIKRPYQ